MTDRMFQRVTGASVAQYAAQCITKQSPFTQNSRGIKNLGIRGRHPNFVGGQLGSLSRYIVSEYPRVGESSDNDV